MKKDRNKLCSLNEMAQGYSGLFLDCCPTSCLIGGHGRTWEEDDAEFSLPFKVYTNASFGGLGAVLTQVQEGRERVIAYASRSLHTTERNYQNYSSFKMELLALKWAVTERFKDYLWGVLFVVFTDNNLLVHLENSKLRATEQRWVAQLANYQFEIKYRPGPVNINADILSRLPEERTALLLPVVVELPREDRSNIAIPGEEES